MSLLQLAPNGLQQFIRDRWGIFGETVLHVTGWKETTEQFPELIPSHSFHHLVSTGYFPEVFVLRVPLGCQSGGKETEHGLDNTPGLDVEAQARRRIVEGTVASKEQVSCMVDDVSQSGWPDRR